MVLECTVMLYGCTYSGYVVYSGYVLLFSTFIKNVGILS